MNIITEFDEYYAGSMTNSGAAHAVSSDPDQTNEAIRLLHEAIKDVTGKDIEQPPKRRMGFLE